MFVFCRLAARYLVPGFLTFFLLLFAGNARADAFDAYRPTASLDLPRPSR